jgi:hypothetical protein
MDEKSERDHLIGGSSVKVMEPIAVVDKFLFPVLTAVDRRAEVPDPGSLPGRAERAEGRVYVTCLLPYRTVIDSINQLHGISPGKRRAGRVPGFVKNKHAECCEQVIEEAYAGIAVASIRALTDHHIPVGFLLMRDRFLHSTERSLLVPEPDCLVRTEQVFVDLLCQPVPVFRCKFLNLCTKIPFHLLDIRRRMTEREKSNFPPEFPAGESQLEIPAFARDPCTGGISITMILVDEQEQGHGTGQYLRISDFLPQEYTFSKTDHPLPEYFYIIHPNNYPW